MIGMFFSLCGGFRRSIKCGLCLKAQHKELVHTIAHNTLSSVPGSNTHSKTSRGKCYHEQWRKVRGRWPTELTFEFSLGRGGRACQRTGRG